MLVKADFRDTVVREVFGHLRARIDRGSREVSEAYKKGSRNSTREVSEPYKKALWTSMRADQGVSDPR